MAITVPRLNCLRFSFVGVLKKNKCKKPPHVRRTERFQHRIKLNNRTATNARESEFPITVPKMCGYRRTTFPTSSVIRHVIFTYVFSLFIIMHEQSERSAVQLICLGGVSRLLTACPQPLLQQAWPQVERNSYYLKLHR